jgi:hypothetical protein
LSKFRTDEFAHDLLYRDNDVFAIVELFLTIWTNSCTLRGSRIVGDLWRLDHAVRNFGARSNILEVRREIWMSGDCRSAFSARSVIREISERVEVGRSLRC